MRLLCPCDNPSKGMGTFAPQNYLTGWNPTADLSRLPAIAVGLSDLLEEPQEAGGARVRRVYQCEHGLPLLQCLVYQHTNSSIHSANLPFAPHGVHAVRCSGLHWIRNCLKSECNAEQRDEAAACHR